jgi:hypothetical protein
MWAPLVPERELRALNSSAWWRRLSPDKGGNGCEK